VLDYLAGLSDTGQVRTETKSEIGTKPSNTVAPPVILLVATRPVVRSTASLLHSISSMCHNLAFPIALRQPNPM
jgi:hypothetical protein